MCNTNYDKKQIATEKIIYFIFIVGFVLAVSEAFIPLDQFIHRGDDAYYYFEIAINYAKYGFWTFDGIHNTNGVQPLWAIILSVLAKILFWFDVQDKNVIARLFVAFTGVIHFLSCVVLYRLLCLRLNPLVAIISAGAFLFPMGILWSRVWGMENSLYALLLLTTVYYFHKDFLEKDNHQLQAVILGILLGLTMLSRLNAGLFAACLMSYYLFFRKEHAISKRLYLFGIVTICSMLLIIPYFIWNYQSTGHFFPVSGVVKSIATQKFLNAYELPTQLTLDFYKRVWWEYHKAIEWFIVSRSLDATWLFGGRTIIVQDSASKFAFISLWLTIISSLLILWTAGALQSLKDNLSKLAVFVYLPIYGVVNALMSVTMYPTQLNYAMIRWWFVENKIIIVVITSVFIASVLSVFHKHYNVRVKKICAVYIIVLLSLHVFQFHKLYWRNTYVPYDWRLSWNDESYKAALWMNNNIPMGTRIGSWNAGVLGYYCDIPSLINLDGLVNNEELIPYLESNNISRYILEKEIRYLSDLEVMFHNYRIYNNLELTEVYRSYSSFMKSNYYIYRVDGLKKSGDQE